MNAQRQTRNQAREAAREKAKSMRLASNARQKRNRFFVQLGLALAALLVIGALGAVVTTALRPAGPGPLNMQSDGIKIGAGNVAVRTPALASDAKPVSTPANAAGVVDVTIFLDYLCPYCGEFEKTNRAALEDLITRGAATVEIHPISILYARSQGTEYSRRAANAAACVANYYPDSYLKFNDLLFDKQPAEQTQGLSDQEILQLATDAGAGGEVKSCIKSRQFWPWVLASTDRALKGTLAINNLDPKFKGIQGTPTVLINGQEVQFSYPYNPDEFLSAIQQAAGTTN